MDINNWLAQQLISSDAYDAENLLSRFLEAMEQGLAGGASSLAMLPAWLEAAGDMPADRPVAVIDAGGTNLRICTAHFDADGRVHVDHFSKQPMPGRDQEVTADEFYAVLVDTLESFGDAFEQIGFCFSYPTEILPDLDGRLLYWTKEIKIPELVGRRIGSGLKEALMKRGLGEKRVVVLNDTVATLLAGLSKGRAFNASSYVGLILGTGTNTAYVEHNRNILKADTSYEDGLQIVNVESGGFDAFERGPFDQHLDAESNDPGRYHFEKTISGVYLGSLTLVILQRLAGTGVFSDGGTAALSIMKELSTIHIDNLVAENGRDTGVLETEIFSDEDRKIMKQVFDAVVDRATLFTAANIAAAVIKSGKGRDPERPVCVNIDGSTYYKTYRFAERTQAQLQKLLKPRGLHIRCVQVDDAPVVGAAIAGLTSCDGVISPSSSAPAV